MGGPINPVRDSNGVVVEATDWLGNQVRVGEKVIYCISAGRGQQMAIGVLLELRPILVEDESKITIFGDNYGPIPASPNYGWRRHQPGEPHWGSFWDHQAQQRRTTWIKFETYEYCETKVQRVAASGYEKLTKKDARFVNEMNVMALEGLKEAADKL